MSGGYRCQYKITLSRLRRFQKNLSKKRNKIKSIGLKIIETKSPNLIHRLKNQKRRIEDSLLREEYLKMEVEKFRVLSDESKIHLNILLGEKKIVVRDMLDLQYNKILKFIRSFNLASTHFLNKKKGI
jgi:hypothetical protein